MRLRNLGFDHIAVNHSIGFATTNNSIGHTNGNELFNTNMIEGMWTAVKHAVPRRYRTVSNCPWKLLEFLWRQDIINNLPIRVPGDYSQYEYQEDNQLVEFVDLPNTYSSDSDSSTESESDNHS
ncbi:hypothetical protein INT45_013617 [Circinella minor]|uniref:Transposase n=1 Tax=Circinella minor TaxID=1195481 RepID=A0A8H7V8F2_9FUNG|nr:hypothetical protein INT45_013617 [Circinella minor]